MDIDVHVIGEVAERERPTTLEDFTFSFCEVSAMESSSDEYGLYLRLLLVAATITACIAQISSSMELLNEVACHPPTTISIAAKSSSLHSAPCVSCASASCDQSH